MAKKTINASDLGSYLYCQRAWWYQQKGAKSTNQAAMETGTHLHAEHGRQVFLSGLLRFAGWLLLLAGLVTLALLAAMAVV